MVIGDMLLIQDEVEKDGYWTVIGTDVSLSSCIHVFTTKLESIGDVFSPPVHRYISILQLGLPFNPRMMPEHFVMISLMVQKLLRWQTITVTQTLLKTILPRYLLCYTTLCGC